MCKKKLKYHRWVQICICSKSKVELRVLRYYLKYTEFGNVPAGNTIKPPGIFPWRGMRHTNYIWQYVTPSASIIDPPHQWWLLSSRTTGTMKGVNSIIYMHIIAIKHHTIRCCWSHRNHMDIYNTILHDELTSVDWCILYSRRNWTNNERRVWQ